ncbi:hypothetical protein V6N12_056544 [Hibiscus sabdariffa]|uniref:Beta-glucosidase n=1 Tax=Hibiscus sabdariffa TaxID=183260 RepID=A0ABR2CST7_9ROSI
MHTKKGIALAIALLVLGIQTGVSQNISRASFPEGFVFGTASASYQYEGAVKEDGRQPTIWDTFSHSTGIIIDGSNADVAVDQYHRYVEDIQLMKDMVMDAYRFSIAWSRIFPSKFAPLVFGRDENGDNFVVFGTDGSGEINQAGVDHYNNLINALLAKGIEPYVTLYHWDLPQALEDKYIGWLDRQIMFLDPLIFGDYPSSMRSRVGTRLPTFTESESALLKGSLDFVGINHYTTYYASENATNTIDDLLNDVVSDADAHAIRMDDPNSILIPIEDALKDEKRIKYHTDYLTNLLAAIE